MGKTLRLGSGDLPLLIESVQAALERVFLYELHLIAIQVA
jgi:hypothetical protein